MDIFMKFTCQIALFDVNKHLNMQNKNLLKNIKNIAKK